VSRDLSFHADLVEDEGEFRVVLSGDIDLAAVPEFFARMQQADRVAEGVVIVVMRDVTLIDSSGLGVLARLAAAGVEMELRGAQGVVRRALEIGGLDKIPNVRVR
jgi:anti-anti-sigma factor